MCGRYTLTKEFRSIKTHFKVFQSSTKFEPRFNIAPSQFVPVITSEKNGLWLHSFRWGMIPKWAKSASMGNKLINARAETIQKKSSFKYSFGNKRCLVPADGFYEWQGTENKKKPQYIHLKGEKLFAFAGLWAEWKQREKVIRSFCIITTEANIVLKPIHHRMPVILSSDQYESWLGQESTMQRLTSLLNPYPDNAIAFRPVSTMVNSPKNDSADCLI